MPESAAQILNERHPPLAGRHAHAGPDERHEHAGPARLDQPRPCGFEWNGTLPRHEKPLSQPTRAIHSRRGPSWPAALRPVMRWRSAHAGQWHFPLMSIMRRHVAPPRHASVDRCLMSAKSKRPASRSSHGTQSFAGMGVGLRDRSDRARLMALHGSWISCVLCKSWNPTPQTW